MLMSGFINGKNIYLRKLSIEDARPEYLSWLNDPEILRYRGPKAYPSNMGDLRQFLDGIQNTKDLYLAVCLRKDGRHIGGISLTAINFIHRTSEVSIMIGDKSMWGKNYSTESVAILSLHAFHNMNLNKLWAESPNSRFNAIMKKLSWVHEGTKRKMFYLDGEYVDVEFYGLLKCEFDLKSIQDYIAS